MVLRLRRQCDRQGVRAHFFFQAEDGIRDIGVTGVQTCALPISTYNVGRRRQDYSGFNKLSHEQSKLVALFLVNTANLLPDGYMEKAQAQRALTNYWGNFLLF